MLNYLIRPSALAGRKSAAYLPTKIHKIPAYKAEDLIEIKVAGRARKKQKREPVAFCGPAGTERSGHHGSFRWPRDASTEFLTVDKNPDVREVYYLTSVRNGERGR